MANKKDPPVIIYDRPIGAKWGACYQPICDDILRENILPPKGGTAARILKLKTITPRTHSK
jgi:hypothetical protein